METRKCSSTQEEEDYIEMELTASSNTSSPSKKSREFEFQMSTFPQGKESATPCPADELFYKGQLLPLQLPPRLQMVQKLLLLQQQQPSFGNTKQDRDEEEEEEEEEEDQCSSTPTFMTTSFTAPPTNSSTPLQSQSCSISPAESCRASCELNPDEYFFQWSTDVSGLIVHHPKKSWSKKFWLINQSSLSQRLKASRAYLKSLFIKSAAACSDESSPANAKAAEIQGQGNVQSKSKDYLSRYIKVGRKIPLGHFDKQVTDDDRFFGPRRSFSGAIKRHCGAKCLSSSTSSSTSSSSNSSSFSIKSNGFYEINFLKRSSSLNSEIESAIEAAIAHCKRSQQQHCSFKHETGIGSCLSSPPAKVAACQDNGKSELSRI